MRERRKKGKGGQRFKSERRKKRRKKRRRRWQRQTLEHENGLCHPFSSAELGDKGSVSASRFFQHLLDDNSYLSPHQRKEREESAEHTVLHVCFSSFTSYRRPPYSRFFPPSLPASRPSPTHFFLRRTDTQTLKRRFPWILNRSNSHPPPFIWGWRLRVMLECWWCMETDKAD